MAPKKKPWFRFYCETMTDAKLRRTPPDQRWVWPALMSLARSSPITGALLVSEGMPVTVEDVADHAAVTVKVAAKAIESFTAMGMVAVDEHLGCWVLPKWSERQFESDDTAARTAKHRNKPKEPECNDDGTFHRESMERSGSADVTHQRQTTETETEDRTTYSGTDTDDSATGDRSSSDMYNRVLELVCEAIYERDKATVRKTRKAFLGGVKPRQNRESGDLIRARLITGQNPLDIAREIVEDINAVRRAADTLGHAYVDVPDAPARPELREKYDPCPHCDDTDRLYDEDGEFVGYCDHPVASVSPIRSVS